MVEQYRWRPLGTNDCPEGKHLIVAESSRTVFMPFTALRRVASCHRCNSYEAWGRDPNFAQCPEETLA